MNAYFFKMNPQERNNILDQHKSIYDGFKTNYGMNKEQPLYVQDFANDKGGLTVSNKGNVDVYKNMNINEADAFTGAKYLPDESFDFGGPDEYVTMGEQKDMIGDGPNDLEHGTFGDEEIEDFNDYEDEEQLDREEYLRVQDKCPHCDGFGTVEGDSEYSIDGIEDCEICGGTGKRSQINQAFHSLRDELESDVFESLQEQVKKTKDMFNRIKKY